jgi:hypothetical protein
MRIMYNELGFRLVQSVTERVQIVDVYGRTLEFKSRFSGPQSTATVIPIIFAISHATLVDPEVLDNLLFERAE